MNPTRSRKPRARKSALEAVRAEPAFNWEPSYEIDGVRWTVTDPAPEPSVDDRAWWALESDRSEVLETRAAESAARDRHERGLIAPDVSDLIARTSLVGHPA